MTITPKTVLIVEDEPDAAELFSVMMRVNGYEVIKMFVSTPAMKMISQVKPNIVIMDIMMPDVSGLEVIKFMRRDESLKHIPVVVVSAKSSPEDIQAGMDAGATKYLTKPVAYMDLLNAVQNLIGSAQEPVKTD
jgi:twitching motility two-component system response regulator PilG